MKRILQITVVAAALLAGGLSFSSDANAAHCQTLQSGSVGTSGFTQYCYAGEGYAAGNSWYYYEYAAIDLLGTMAKYRFIEWWYLGTDNNWYRWGCQSNYRGIWDTVTCPRGL